MKKGQAGSNEKFSLEQASVHKRSKSEKKSIISGGKGQVVVQRKTIEKDLEAEGGKPTQSLVKTNSSE